MVWNGADLSQMFSVLCYLVFFLSGPLDVTSWSGKRKWRKEKEGPRSFPPSFPFSRWKIPMGLKRRREEKNQGWEGNLGFSQENWARFRFKNKCRSSAKHMACHEDRFYLRFMGVLSKAASMFSCAQDPVNER